MNKKTLLGAAVVLALTALLVGVYTWFSPQTTAGNKEITIAVDYADGTSESYALDTTAEYLKEAAETVLRLDGEEGPYGFTVLGINGHTADFSTEAAYWAIYVNGEYGQYAVDQQPVAEGDSFLFAYETT